MPTTNFTQLNVWKAAHEETLQIYRITQGYPSEERYRLADQMRRAAISIPANIAEGMVGAAWRTGRGSTI